MSRETYDRRYVIGKYTPKIPDRIHVRMSRSAAIRRGMCIECRVRERDADHTHCRVCLDAKARYRR